jgi:NodT family efflux transporter outer membrane factor (OMF) lipoprotein
MHPLLKSFSFSLLFALFASSCITVGPNYQSPSAPREDQWLEYEDPNLETGPPVLPEWWKTAFNDPILDKLIDEALDENLTLRSAGLRVLQSRQQLAIAVGSLFPQQQAISGEVGPGRSGLAKFDVYDLGFNLSWEADVWGSFRRNIETASASLDASVADYDGVMVSLIAQVAQTYLLIRTTEQRLKVARENIEYQEESVRITSEKRDIGDTSPLDADQAETLLYNTKSTASGLELSLQQLKNSLAILLGKPPHNLNKRLGDARPIPTVAPEIAVGMRQDLIRQRPDIRVAERQLAAQSAQIGVAVSELYPHFGIDGLIGTSVSTGSGLNFDNLFSGDSFDYNLTGFFDWNLFNYGRLKNNVRLQDAVFQELL